jgi:ABC-type sugar transport system ATPase subunit
VGTPRINILPAAVSDGNIHVAESDIHIKVDDSQSALPSAFTLGFRPEDVQISPEGPQAGEVILVEPLGVETIIYIRSGQQTLLSVVAGMAHWRVGDHVRFDVTRQHLHFFDGEGQRI